VGKRISVNLALVSAEAPEDVVFHVGQGWFSDGRWAVRENLVRKPAWFKKAQTVDMDLERTERAVLLPAPRQVVRLAGVVIDPNGGKTCVAYKASDDFRTYIQALYADALGLPDIMYVNESYTVLADTPTQENRTRVVCAWKFNESGQIPAKASVAGKPSVPDPLSNDDLSDDMQRVITDDNVGRCRACGAERGGVEPDARKYPCDECGKNEVYGLQELMLMGELK
jgi:hypothetical protein